MAEEQQPLSIDTERMTKLASTLRSRFTEYDKARQSVEQQWLKNVRQYIGEYDPDVLAHLSQD